MTAEELEVLLKEIAMGRSEDGTLEWKRAWWDFKVEAQRHEFVKDISAMANATGAVPRHILVGVAPSAVLHTAPMPEDEARLQERLHAITPVPHVSFQQVDVRTVVVTVISIDPPFDRPYVARLGKQNAILVRAGSSTRTVTRADLDRWYGARRESARAEDERRRSSKAMTRRAFDLHRHVDRLERLAILVATEIDNRATRAAGFKLWAPNVKAIDSIACSLRREFVAGPASLSGEWSWLLRAAEVANRDFSDALPHEHALALAEVREGLESRIPGLREDDPDDEPGADS